MGGFVAAQGAGEIVFDFFLRVAAVLLAELHADPGRSFSLRALRGHPDDTSRNRQFLFFAHEIQQHEDFIAKTIVAVGGNEEAAIFDEGHVRKIQRAFILDGERQQTRLVTWTSQFLAFPKKLTGQRVPAAEQQGLQRQLQVHTGRGEPPDFPCRV